jgi:hypothetical protein
MLWPAKAKYLLRLVFCPAKDRHCKIVHKHLVGGENPMLFMVIETFGPDPKAVYRRFQDKGRQMPDGLDYVDSWVTADFARCFQLMRCDDVTLLQRWVAEWRDLVDFEIVPVAPSRETAAAMASRL